MTIIAERAEVRGRGRDVAANQRFAGATLARHRRAYGRSRGVCYCTQAGIAAAGHLAASRTAAQRWSATRRVDRRRWTAAHRNLSADRLPGGSEEETA